jgi:hypothetical protein
VVIASERMDSDPAWRELSCGELLHIDGALEVRSRLILAHPPARPLGLGDLDPAVRASQAQTVGPPWAATLDGPLFQSAGGVRGPREPRPWRDP